jgi:hypothetical protein
MSGPIVRTGTTPKYGENWDKIFTGRAKAPAPNSKVGGAKAAVTKAQKVVARAAGKATAAAKSVISKTGGATAARASASKTGKAKSGTAKSGAKAKAGAKRTKKG